MQKFYTLSMLEIIKKLKEQLKTKQAKEIIEFEVFNPDSCTSTYAGNSITLGNVEYIYRGYSVWTDLAQTLQCKMLTPQINLPHTIIIKYEKLNTDDSFHKTITDKEKKYGSGSIFSKIHKMQEPAFISHYLKALENVDVNKRIRILNLGVNSGDEFEVIKEYATSFKNLELVGVDYCDSAINEAKKKFQKDANISFYTHDINNLASLKLGLFDLIISVGTLQSSNLDFNPLLMSIVQNQLKKDGAMILGFPNCRWVDGEMIYGARVKNYAFSEMGLLYKDVIFSKKYLQQKKFRVTITGKDYIFITATSIRKVN
jgi:cyclopropane fatty-acyl-phospholipid synthase-like methyltransferase